MTPEVKTELKQLLELVSESYMTKRLIERIEEVVPGLITNAIPLGFFPEVSVSNTYKAEVIELITAELTRPMKLEEEEIDDIL